MRNMHAPAACVCLLSEGCAAEAFAKVGERPAGRRGPSRASSSSAPLGEQLLGAEELEAGFAPGLPPWGAARSQRPHSSLSPLDWAWAARQAPRPTPQQAGTCSSQALPPPPPHTHTPNRQVDSFLGRDMGLKSDEAVVAALKKSKFMANMTDGEFKDLLKTSEQVGARGGGVGGEW